MTRKKSDAKSQGSIPLLAALKHDRWVKPFLKQSRGALYLALFLGFMTFFCAGALMFNSGFLISKSATHPYNILLVYVPIVLTRAFGIGRLVFKYFERLVSHDWVLKITSKLRVKLYNVLEEDAIFFKRDYKLGDVMGLLAEDINHLQDLYLKTVFPAVVGWGLSLFAVIGLGFFSLPFAGLMALVLVSITVLMPLWSVILTKGWQASQKAAKQALYVDLTDNVLGVSDWIFSMRGGDYVARHENHEAQLSALQDKLTQFANRRSLFLQLLFGLGTVILLVFGASVFGDVKSGSSNWIAAFALALFPLVDALITLPGAIQETSVYTEGLTRLNDLSARSEAKTKTKNSPVKTTAHQEVQILKTPIQIEVNNLTFAYEQGSGAVLSNLNLSIPQGQKLAILGKSGSGKSTLANLLRGDLSASEGTITYNGVEVSRLGDAIARYVGVIQQTPYLFNTTIENNLRLGNEEATDDQLWTVLKRVGLDKLVANLPNGLKTMVDSAGLRFSGGERHRLALARILLQAVPVVILDEPTVGLDPKTESELIKTFMDVLAGKTVIWITHHLQGIDRVDKVIFIEDGQLDMAGSPAELEKTNARYRRLRLIDQGRQ